MPIKLYHGCIKKRDFALYGSASLATSSRFQVYNLQSSMVSFFKLLRMPTSLFFFFLYTCRPFRDGFESPGGGPGTFLGVSVHVLPLAYAFSWSWKTCPGWSQRESGSRINKSFCHRENICSEYWIWISDVSVIQSYILFAFLSSSKSSSIIGIMLEVSLCLILLILARQGSSAIEHQRDFYVIIRNCSISIY